MAGSVEGEDGPTFYPTGAPGGIGHRVHRHTLLDTFTHMKTTVEIPDPILSQARKVAAREGTTVRALIEEGLRKVLGERTRSGEFRLRKASFKGKGLHPEMRDAAWDRIRDAAYEGRGT
jgi:hypothetical protein